MVGRALKDCSVLQVQEAPWLPTVLTWAGGGVVEGGAAVMTSLHICLEVLPELEQPLVWCSVYQASLTMLHSLSSVAWNTLDIEKNYTVQRASPAAACRPADWL